LGVCSLLGIFLKISTSFSQKALCINLDKNGLGDILGDFFSQNHLVTLLSGASRLIMYYA
jgi:hypothetical protein